MTRFVIAAIETDHLCRNAGAASRAGKRTWVVGSATPGPPGRGRPR